MIQSRYNMGSLSTYTRDRYKIARARENVGCAGFVAGTDLSFSLVKWNDAVSGSSYKGQVHRSVISFVVTLSFEKNAAERTLLKERDARDDEYGVTNYFRLICIFSNFHEDKFGLMWWARPRISGLGTKIPRPPQQSVALALVRSPSNFSAMRVHGLEQQLARPGRLSRKQNAPSLGARRLAWPRCGHRSRSQVQWERAVSGTYPSGPHISVEFSTMATLTFAGAATELTLPKVRDANKRW